MSDAPQIHADRPTEGAVMAQSLEQAAESRQKSKNLKPLMRLWPYLMAQKTDFALMLCFLLLSSGTQLGLTAGLKYLVDDGFKSGDAARLNLWFLIIGLVALTLAVATALRYFFITKLGERIIANLRKDLFSHILSLDPAFFMKIKTGEVVSRLTTDIQLIENLVASSISIALRNILGFVGGLILLMFVSAKLTLLVLLIFPVVLIPLFTYGKRVGSLTRQTQDSFAKAVGFASEALDALETVQAFVREAFTKQKFTDAVEESYAHSLKRMGARAIMTGLIISLVFGGVATVLWLGAQDVIGHKMTVGTLIQFVTLAILVAGSVANLSETWGDVQKAAGAMGRIDELMSANPTLLPPVNPQKLIDFKGEILFDSVDFAYPSRPDMPVLKNFSLHVKAGETVAIVGPSGAGKSSVFKLLLRFYDPQTGLIAVDNIALDQLDPQDLRSEIALVAQDQSLFSGTPYDNIRFGRENATEADIIGAAKAAQAHDFIEALPETYQQPLGERAKSLSGGQKQRLAIARALVRDAPILLLDEATSALDAENERLVQIALEAAMKGRTTLVIAHRLATVLRADRIVVMDEGRIVESGTHDTLVANEGLYARLASLQFQM